MQLKSSPNYDHCKLLNLPMSIIFYYGFALRSPKWIIKVECGSKWIDVDVWLMKVYAVEAGLEYDLTDNISCLSFLNWYVKSGEMRFSL